MDGITSKDDLTYVAPADFTTATPKVSMAEGWLGAGVVELRFSHEKHDQVTVISLEDAKALATTLTELVEEFPL